MPILKPLNLSQLNSSQKQQLQDYLTEDDARERGVRNINIQQQKPVTILGQVRSSLRNDDQSARFASQHNVSSRFTSEGLRQLTQRRNITSSSDLLPSTRGMVQSQVSVDFSTDDQPKHLIPILVTHGRRAKSNLINAPNLLTNRTHEGQTRSLRQLTQVCFLPSLGGRQYTNNSASAQFQLTPLMSRIDSPPMLRQPRSNSQPNIGGGGSCNSSQFFHPSTMNDLTNSNISSSQRLITPFQKLSPQSRKILPPTARTPSKERKFKVLRRQIPNPNNYLPYPSFIDPEFVLPENVMSPENKIDISQPLSPSKLIEDEADPQIKSIFRVVGKAELASSSSILKAPKSKQLLQEKMHKCFLAKQRRPFTKDDLTYVEDMMRRTHFNDRSPEDDIVPGNEGIEQQFREVQKRIKKLEDRDMFLRQKSSFLVELVTAMNEASLLPKKMMFLEDNKNCTELNLNNIPMTNKQAEIFAKVLTIQPYSTHLLALSVTNNQMNDEHLGILLNCIPPKTTNLILRNNHISNRGIKLITSATINQLVELDVSSNRISSEGARELFGALLTRKSPLQKLNLSSNLIDDQAVQSMCLLISSPQSELREISLRWNQLRQSGGRQIASALNEASSFLKVFDISNNSIGCPLMEKSPSHSKSTVLSLGELFAQAIANTSLLHLDLSNCGLNKADCQSIARAINSNQTLIGFHIEGNEPTFTVDPYGFVRQSLQQVTTEIPSKTTQQQITGVQYNPKKAKHFNEGSICWLCEGWSPVEFTVQITDDCLESTSGNYIYLHLEFNSYAAIQMNPLTSSGPPNRFTKTVMCPPNNEFKYFLSSTKTFSASPPHTFLDLSSTRKELDMPQSLQVDYPTSDQRIQFDVKKFNVRLISPTSIFNEKYNQVDLRCIIRETYPLN